MSRASNMSRDSTYSMGSLQTGLSGDTGSLPSLMAQNDWEIAPMDIEIMRREDGSPWELGAGAFGKVHTRPALLSLSSLCRILTDISITMVWTALLAALALDYSCSIAGRGCLLHLCPVCL